MSISPFSGHKRSIRTPYDRHRFVTRGTLGWIETGDFDKVPPDLRFFAGGDRSIRGYKYKSIAPKYANGDLKGASKLINRIAGVPVQRDRKMVGRGVCR